MNSVPRLSIGLPVYNGENYLAESLDALLGQTYEDFELIISDNASTDGTADICRRYAKQDSRIRYIRQPRNIGCAPNHNTGRYARGELFKWASDDDLYARDLIERASRRSTSTRVVLAHRWTAMIDSSRKVIKASSTRWPRPPRTPRPVPEHAVRRRGRRRRRRHPDGGAPPDPRRTTATTTPTGLRSPRSRCRARSTRSPTGCTSGGTTPSVDPRVHDRAYQLYEPGPAPGGPAAPPGRPSAGRIRRAYVTMIQRAPLSAADSGSATGTWSAGRPAGPFPAKKRKPRPSPMPSYRSRPPWPRPAAGA